MSYKPQQQQFSQFRQSLTFEDIVKQQISKCLEARNLGEERGYIDSVSGLVDLITPKMMDEIYIAKIRKLAETDNLKAEVLRKDYKKQLRACSGGCPDLVEPPSGVPDRQYWQDAFAICLALFERKGLLMKPAVEDYI